MSSNKAKFRKRERLAAGAIAGGTALGTLGLQAAPASAVPFPGNSKYSYYIRDWSASGSYDLGCSVAINAAYDFISDALAILDFGAQAQSCSSSTGWGVYQAGSQYFHSDAEVRIVAKNFISGFWDCRNQGGFTAHLRLGVGTNNDGTVNNQAGAAWGENVNYIAYFTSAAASGVQVYGANDIEMDYSGYSAVSNWVSGWQSRTSRLYMNYGSANGCPESGGDWYSNCDGWTVGQIYNVSWGFTPAVPVPEIYMPLAGETRISGKTFGISGTALRAPLCTTGRR